MGDGPRRIGGAIIGGALGVLAYWLALQRGYHLLAAVAVGPGVGSGWLAGRRSIAWGVAISGLSVAMTVFSEWLSRPFDVDGSLGYFVTHLGELTWKAQLSIVAAAAVGFYFGMGRNPKGKPPQPA